MKPKNKPRKGWELAFKKMHENGEDQLLISDFFEDENVAIEMNALSAHPHLSQVKDQKQRNNKNKG